MKKSLVRLALNQFFGWFQVAKNRISKTFSATTYKTNVYHLKFWIWSKPNSEYVEFKLNYTQFQIKYRAD